MRNLLLPIIVLAGLAGAQSTAEIRPVDPSLLLDLIGSGRSLSIQAPTFKSVHLVAVHDGEVLSELSQDVLQADTVAIDAVILPTAGCENGITLYARVETPNNSSARGLCYEGERFGRPARLPPVLGGHRSSVELPTDRWLLLAAVQPLGGQHMDPEQLVNYYLYLGSQLTEDPSTGTGLTPVAPDYTTWEQVQRAFH